jgi:hypothetical protein
MTERPERKPPAPSPVGRMIVFALARAEGLDYTNSMRVVEQFVKPGAPIPELEDVLMAVQDIVRERG